MPGSSSPIPLTEARRAWLGWAVCLWVVCCGGAGSAWAYDGYDCADVSLMTRLAQQARLDPQGGGRIQRLLIECDMDLCQTPEKLASFVRLMDLCVGAPDSQDVLEAARKRLLQTGFFAKERRRPGRSVRSSVPVTDYRVEVVDGGSEVTFTISAATIVNSIAYAGTWPLLESDVERRLQLGRGSAYPTLDEMSERVASVRALYRQESGYYNTKVEVERSDVGSALEVQTICDVGLEGFDCRREPLLKPRYPLVDVVVRIEKGETLEVSRVVLGGFTKFTYQKLRSLLLEPMGLFGSFTDLRLKEGIQNLLGAYRELGYYRARVVDRALCMPPSFYQGQRGELGGDVEGCTSGREEAVEVRLELDEGPRWALEFLGNKDFSVTDLRKEVTFSESGYVDDVEIGRSVDALRGFYETRGHYFATVKGAELIPDAENEDERQITFEIKEGPRLEIRQIRFVGNESIPGAELLQAMSTKAQSTFVSAGFLQRAELESDLGRLVQAYQRQGFLSAMAPRWELAVERSRGEIFLAVNVDEGQQTRVQRVYIDQLDLSESSLESPPLSDEELLERLELKSDAPFSLQGLKDDQGRLLLAYQRRGHPRAKVEAQCRPTPSPRSKVLPPWGKCELPKVDEACLTRESGEPLANCQKGQCSELSPGDNMEVWCCERSAPDLECSPQGGIQTDKIDVKYRVVPGPAKVVSDVFIRGNFKTRTSIIRSEVPLETGDVFDRGKLYEGQSNLRSLGLFEAVTIEPVGLKDDAIALNSASSRVAVVVILEEATSLLFQGSLGGQSRNLLEENARFLVSSEVALVERNFLGFARGLQLSGRLGVDMLELINGGFLSSLPNAFRPGEEIVPLDFLVATELIFFAPRSIIARSEFSWSLFATLDQLGFENEDLDKQEFGSRLSLRKDLSKELTQGLSAQVSLEISNSTTRSRSQNLRLNNGDRLYAPRVSEWKLTFNPVLDRRRKEKLNPTHGYLANLSLEYAFEALEFFGNSTEYLKLTANWSQYFTFFKTATFGYGLQVGRAMPLGGTELLPADERFRLGGTNSLRGFRDNGVGPQTIDNTPLGGELLMVGHLELRFPLIRDLALFGVYFIDGGLLVDCRENQLIVDEDDFASLDRVSCLDDLTPEDLRLSAGIGLRYLVVGRIPLAVDYGLLLNRRFGEEIGGVTLNVGYIF